jgi:hypothetical protein
MTNGEHLEKIFSKIWDSKIVFVLSLLLTILLYFIAFKYEKIIFAFFGGIGVFYICMKIMDFIENWLKSEYKGKKYADNTEQENK